MRHAFKVVFKQQKKTISLAVVMVMMDHTKVDVNICYAVKIILTYDFSHHCYHLEHFFYSTLSFTNGFNTVGCI